MKIESSGIITNTKLKGSYYKVEFYSPEICDDVKPGQFVHMQILCLKDKIFRRPFSIFNVSDAGVLTIVYKVVGDGTETLSRLKAGMVCNLLGPLGNPYTLPHDDKIPILITGGYGAAATYILAKNSMKKGTLLVGAKTKRDLLFIEDYKKLNFNVEVATEDGSAGELGMVTDLLKKYVASDSINNNIYYACGPAGMMNALMEFFAKKDLECELSLDHQMCCGVGACFACVVKVKDSSKEQGWSYARTCSDGPVFNSKKLFID